MPDAAMTLGGALFGVLLFAGLLTRTLRWALGMWGL